MPATLLSLLVALVQAQAACPSGDARACALFAEHLRAGRSAPAESTWVTLRYLATGDEAREWFATGDPAAREAFLLRFWTLRAAASAGHPEERYAEHVRRVERAERDFARGDRRLWCAVIDSSAAERCAFPAHFAPQAVQPPPGVDSVRYASREVPVDDRGLALIRHGEPDVRARCGHTLGDRGEAWIYTRGGEEPRILLFSPLGRLTDFKLVTALSDLGCGPDVGWLAGEVAAHDPDFHRLFTAGDAFAAQTRQQALRLTQQRTADRAARTEEAAPRYDAALETAWEILDFAGPADRPGTIEATLALLLRPPAGVARLRVALVAYDSTGVVARLDTTLATPASPEPVALATVLDVPAGAYRFALRVEALGAGAPEPDTAGVRAGYVGRVHAALPRLRSAPGITLSALALAFPGTPGDWTRAGEPLALDPAHRLPAGRARTRLFYEAYGLREDDVVETRVTVEPLDRSLFSRPREVALRFSDRVGAVPASGDFPVLRDLDLRELEPGEYRVRVRLRRESDGAAAERETRVRISK